MEEGSLRCDLNVSVAPLVSSSEDDDDNEQGSLLKRAGNRVEVKNLNSMRQIQLAAEYEAIRQVEAVTDDDPTGQETRTFDVKSGKTVVMRTKGGARDYRFMPEPDLPPIILSEKVSYR
jgi:aspartyl-tRNA(Asn)/glutamyl-tRNA(Gln) amidotransferase subunit B